MITNSNRTYTSKEVSLTLEISDSTLRKWCLELQKNGYVFRRNEVNHRVFIESDIVILRHLKELVHSHNMPITNASNVIISRFSDEASGSRTDISISSERSSMRSSDEVIETLLTYIEKQETYIAKQEKLNQNLVDQLNRQHEYLISYLRTLENKIEDVGEKDEKIITVLNEFTESKEKTVASIESERNEKKSFWSNLFFKRS